jgi:hypothetical protein
MIGRLAATAPKGTAPARNCKADATSIRLMPLESGPDQQRQSEFCAAEANQTTERTDDGTACEGSGGAAMVEMNESARWRRPRRVSHHSTQRG